MARPNAGGDRNRGWSLEVAIPWANFEKLAHRTEPGTFGPDLSPNPHHPERFGHLVFVKCSKMATGAWHNWTMLFTAASLFGRFGGRRSAAAAVLLVLAVVAVVWLIGIAWGRSKSSGE
jgi:hypothetical protein